MLRVSDNNLLLFLEVIVFVVALISFIVFIGWFEFLVICKYGLSLFTNTSLFLSIQLIINIDNDNIIIKLVILLLIFIMYYN